MIMRRQDSKPRRSAGKNNRSLFRRTIFLMVCLGVVLFIPMVAQLWKLQITQHDYWQERAAGQQLQSVAVNAGRGTIYDSQGEVLAMSATTYNLILSPADLIRNVDNLAENSSELQDESGEVDEDKVQALLDETRRNVAEFLAQLLDQDVDTFLKRLERTGSYYEELATYLEESEAEQVRQFIAGYREESGWNMGMSSILYLVETAQRYYPQSSIASHILGFIAENENSGGERVGAQGLEAAYQDLLTGTSGRVVTGKTGLGSELLSSYEEYFDGQDGYDLHLTIDSKIQAMAEQTLAEGIETYDVKEGGFCIVMDPSTGAILAMASSPEFDPNHYAEIITQSLQEELESVAQQYGEDSEEYSEARSAAYNEQLLNKAVSFTYEPGSVFKPLTVAMALEEGIIDPDDHYYCGGSKVVGGRTIHCHQRRGHGDQNVTQALENSCNVALMDIGEEIGAELMWQYWEDFGLMETTGIDLAGEVDSYFWPEDEFKGPYGAQSVAVASFGQTFRVTPIQMIRAFASVINGGHLLTPYVVQSITDNEGGTVYYRETQEARQVLSETTSEILRGMLESVVANGSGHNAYMAGYKIAGKTGTSEKIGEDTNDVVCSFMGFAPVDNPKVLVLLAYDSPERANGTSQYTPSGTYISGGNITAPMAGQLIADILDYLGMEKQYTSQELASSDTTMIRATGYELTVAKGLVQDRGLNVRTVGTGNIVTAQVPAAGVTIPGGSTVILYLGDEAPEEQVEVPNVSGMSPARAKETLENLGLFLRSTGVSDYTDASVMAVNQSMEAGTMVSMGTVVEVRFASNVIDYAPQDA
ncbi:MAG TPA: PASTA domain-containing protein [Candidatus Enterenecus stercoripullorum]|nr:PASTA domain-containing protein [Candidatus Enterenecus stercoripullorum]